MNILIVGGGGREHALAWKAQQDADRVFVAPGNAGTAVEDKMENISIDVCDIDGLIAFAKSAQIDLTIVGPEAPLTLGIVDAFEAEGLPCFGPSKAAAQLEGSKAFTKDFLHKYNIPTAKYQNFTHIDAAKAYVQAEGTPIVIKADGLAAGKGVIIAHDQEQAFLAIEDMLEGNKFGDAGSRIVIEEFLSGEEASFIVIADGNNCLPFATSQDHKARDDGDKGPNTGGMGAYSPAPVVTSAIHDKIMEQVIQPTLAGMRAEGHPYTGFLYAGIMIDASGGIKVLEFNCRFGDPETQPIMMRMNSNLITLCQAAIAQKLDTASINFKQEAALGVVLAAGGYPDSYAKGNIISGLNAVEDAKVFHAGTQQDEQGQTLTSGGRVLCVTALGQTVSEAQGKAYSNAEKIQWSNVYYRKDIGYRAIQRES